MGSNHDGFQGEGFKSQCNYGLHAGFKHGLGFTDAALN